MANILDRYGIKEVADVTFYKIDGEGNRAEPVLFLDTLKVSTIEQTGEQAEARGGKGNPPLLIWDYGKEINVTLEDALFSAKSMAIMFGDGRVDTNDPGIVKTWTVNTKAPLAATKVLEYGGKNIKVEALDNVTYYTAEGHELTEASGSFTDKTVTPNVENAVAAFMTGTIPVKDVGVIEISANSFPGTYYITGDTYARSEITGEDEFFQFIIKKAKVQSENTITLEAEGDPSIFNMSLRVMRPADGKMMQLVKYNLNVDDEGNEITTTTTTTTEN